MSAPLLGRRLGPYEIGALLGAGGMGEVYRARDTALGRDVAIKILPSAFTADPERRARFEREARLLAALNHPHIGGIYGLEQREGIHGLVLELVEGETLAASLGAGPLPVGEALAIARQVAEALEAAHEKGIVHRDLKPGNVILTRDGVVKVLDFGLAKAGAAGSPDQTHSPTLTAGGTETGVILGTAGYMSPEQARGKIVDKRADIWAFGCVLYEMLTGRRAFGGDTVSDTLVAILDRQPAWEQLPASHAGVHSSAAATLSREGSEAPPARHRRCADRDRRGARSSGGGAFRGSPGAPPPSERRARDTSGAPRGSRHRRAGDSVREAARPAPASRGSLSRCRRTWSSTRRSRSLRMAGLSSTAAGMTRAPVCTSVPSTPSSRCRSGARKVGRLPFFSPDGASVGFWAGRALKTVPLEGGAARTVYEAGGGGLGAWLSDDTIVFASDFRGLRRVPASGGEALQVTTVDDRRGELSHRSPVALPGERAVLLTVHLGGRDTQRVDVVSLDSGRRSALIQGNGGHFLPTGHLLFQRNGSLWVAPFDQKRSTLTGQPMAVIEGVAIALDWAPIVSLGQDGSLAYATGGGDPYPPRTLVWVDRLGREERIEAPTRAWWWPQVSPDGRRLGFHIMDPVNMDAWIYELERGPLVRMTYDARQDGYPLWTPDGKRVAFWSRQAGGAANLYMRSADLTGADVRLTTSPNGQVPFAWARGGSLLVFQEDTPDTNMDIGVVPIEPGRAPELLIRGPSDEAHPSLSPDGRWIAYQSNSSGRWEVYVQPFPGLAGRWQVSTQGGLSPIWHPNGRELFFRNGRAVLSVPVETAGASFRHENPRVLFEGEYVPEGVEGYSARSYDLSPDGRRFLMMKELAGHEAGAETRQIVVISRWIEELKRRIATKR